MPGLQHLLIARADVETRARLPGYEGVGDDGHRRPGQAEPKGREHHDEQPKGRIVGHEDEAVEPGPMVMPAVIMAMSMAMRRSIQRPRDRPVRQEPEVDQAIASPAGARTPSSRGTRGLVGRPSRLLRQARRTSSPRPKPSRHTERHPCRPIWPARTDSLWLLCQPTASPGPVPSHALGCALPSRIECIRLYTRNDSGVYL